MRTICFCYYISTVFNRQARVGINEFVIKNQIFSQLLSWRNMVALWRVYFLNDR